MGSWSRNLVGLAVIPALVMVSVDVRAGDKEDLLAAASAYLAAEAAGDPVRIWNMLAPSSAFKRAYSYPFFLEMTKRNKIRVKDYTVEEVLDVEDNPDPKQMPHVEKIGTVRVRVILTDERGERWEHRSVFTFLKEGGAWYKG